MYDKQRHLDYREYWRSIYQYTNVVSLFKQVRDFPFSCRFNNIQIVQRHDDLINARALRQETFFWSTCNNAVTDKKLNIRMKEHILVDITLK